jgi:hypothetical protein
MPLNQRFETIGRQASEHVYAETGRTIVRLTDNDLFNVHTYYDICPWSHDGRYVVYSGADPDTITDEFGHDGVSSSSGQVFVIDMATREIFRIADTALFNMHSGAMCCWHPRKHAVFYRKNQNCSAMVDLATGRETVFSGNFRQLSPDGELFTVLMRQPHNGGQGAAVGLMAPDGSHFRELIDRETLWELTPNRDEFSPEDMLLGNTKWHPDNEHILIAMWVYPKPKSRRSLYVVHKDGTGSRWLGHMGNHHSWTPRGDAVLCNDQVSDAATRVAGPMRMFLLPLAGGKRQLVIDEPVGSHPLMHHDGNRIVDFDADGIVLITIAEQRVDRLAVFGAEFTATHKGTHAHPVWSRHGSDVLYNSAETGLSQLHLIEGV